MGKKIMIFAGVTTLLQAGIQTALTSLAIAQYFCLIDFLRELPNLLFIRILYFHNPGQCGTRINIGQAIDGLMDQAFVMLTREPFTVTRTFILNCTGLGLSVLWLIASCVLLAGGARNEYSRPIRWPWIVISVAVCSVDLVSTVLFANDSFHTRTLNDVMGYIGGTVSGIGNTEINTRPVAWVMVMLYSRFIIFFCLNVLLIVLVALNKNISNKKDDIFVVESPAIPLPIIPPAPAMPAPAMPSPAMPSPATPAPLQETISPMNTRQVNEINIDDEVEIRTNPEPIVQSLTSAVQEPRTSIPLSNITEVSSNVSRSRDFDDTSMREEDVASTSHIIRGDRENANASKIPRAGFSQAFRSMKKFLFAKESTQNRDSLVDNEQVSPERFHQLHRFYMWFINNYNRRPAIRDNTNSVCNTIVLRRQGRPPLPRSWLVLSAILWRSPRIQYVSEDKKRAVNFPDNLLSLPQRLENMIAEQQRRLDRAVIDTAGRESPPRVTQSLPQLNETNEDSHSIFNKGRRGTAAELQGQLPWAYIPASAHPMRDQLPPDEDLPPVPLPDYTAIPSFRKASVHRAASSLSSLTQKRHYLNHVPRHKPSISQTDVLY